MRFVKVYLSSLVVMLPLDFAFLGTGRQESVLGQRRDVLLDTPRMPPASLFDALYLAGVGIFVIGPALANRTHNLLYKMVFGFF